MDVRARVHLYSVESLAPVCLVMGSLRTCLLHARIYDGAYVLVDSLSAEDDSQMLKVDSLSNRSTA